MIDNTDTNPIQEALHLLQDEGYKLTRARKALIEILATEHGPFSVDDLQKMLSTPCDMATIYRNMALFESLNMVANCDFQDGTARFEWSGPGHHHHHHIICKQCHHIEALEYCFVEELEKLVQDRGFTEVSHRLEFYGLCQECQSAS